MCTCGHDSTFVHIKHSRVQYALNFCLANKVLCTCGHDSTFVHIKHSRAQYALNFCLANKVFTSNCNEMRLCNGPSGYSLHEGGAMVMSDERRLIILTNKLQSYS